MTEGYYFGRFQPPLIKHGQLCQSIILGQPNIELTVGVADNGFGRTQNNFLSGDEATWLFMAMAQELELTGIRAITPIKIYPDRPLSNSLDLFFSQLLSGNQPHRASQRLVFSGSPATQKACAEIQDKHNLKIIPLDDDDITGPRARQVRQGLISGDFNWRELVTPFVFNYLTQPSLLENIRNLQDGVKRPWTQVS